MKRSKSARFSGFTLMEILMVMVIIAILAGISIPLVGMVRTRQDNSVAEVQIKLLAKAIEDYKLDKGSYPEANNASGAGTTETLYKLLYQDGIDNQTKVYLGELAEDSKQRWVKKGERRILDPWKREYYYRSGEAANNPDFDLWSAGKDGKTNASNRKAPENNDDIKL